MFDQTSKADARLLNADGQLWVGVTVDVWQNFMCEHDWNSMLHTHKPQLNPCDVRVGLFEEVDKRGWVIRPLEERFNFCRLPLYTIGGSR